MAGSRRLPLIFAPTVARAACRARASSRIVRPTSLPNPRKDARAKVRLVDSDESALLQHRLVLSEGAHDETRQVLRSDVVGADLDDARSRRPRDRQDGS